MTPEHVFSAIESHPGAVWLDGGNTSWSILSWNPIDVTTRTSDWKTMARKWSGAGKSSENVPFASGCIGYLGYETRHEEIGVPTHADAPEPPLWLGRYEGALCHRDGEWHVAGTKGFQQDARRLLRTLPEPSPHPEPQSLCATHDEDERSSFMEAVRKIRQWIAEGDCYQINMTRAVKDLLIRDPWPIYRQLRTSEAAFGAFLRIRPDLAVLCNSPEMLLRGQHPQVVSEPIKGTRPRSAEPNDDLAQRADLLGSPKDQAELTMIVDLVRHDLGRIAVPGSVQTGERQVTGHANVWHTSQQVQAQLDARHDVWDALETLFPPGSVTGAPKRRACRRIAELESTPRGVYCGSIGYVSDQGQAAWNVAIRSAVWHAGRARYHVGGGIVFDSQPAEEWQETVDKSTELHRAFHAADEPEPNTTRR